MSDGRDYGPILEALWTQVIECRRLLELMLDLWGDERDWAARAVSDGMAWWIRRARVGLSWTDGDDEA